MFSLSGSRKSLRKSQGSPARFRPLPFPDLATRFRAFAERPSAPVAQLDRASDYESEGRTFESFRARQSSEYRNQTNIRPMGGGAGSGKLCHLRVPHADRP